MKHSAMGALRGVLNVKSEDSVLIIFDDKNKEIADAFISAAEDIGAVTATLKLPKERPLKDLPQYIHESISSFRKMPGEYAIVNLFMGLKEETPFRIKLINEEIRAGAKVAHAPGITSDMLIYGALNANFEIIKERAIKLMNNLSGAEHAYITTPAGTEISMNIKGRAFETDAFIRPGSVGNLPAGEIWCAPVEDSANGIIVCDGSIGDVGKVKSPLKIEVENGKIISMECDDLKLLNVIEELVSVDEYADVIGELGIGLNHFARFSGILLEEEKIAGTAHIAFGHNLNMYGGRNPSKTHRDFIFLNPTIIFTYDDGTKKEIISNGKIML